jgi:hypothetical protein
MSYTDIDSNGGTFLANYLQVDADNYYSINSKGLWALQDSAYFYSFYGGKDPFGEADQYIGNGGYQSFYFYQLQTTSTGTPFSVYYVTAKSSGGATYQYGSFSDGVPYFQDIFYKHAIEISASVHHYGTTFSTIGLRGQQTWISGTDPDISYFTTDNSPTATPYFNLPSIPSFTPITMFTAPITTITSNTITIDTTTQTSANFNFVGTNFSYTFISQTTRTILLSHETTRSSTTDKNHFIGTSFKTNNTVFTQWTQNDISPYAIFLQKPLSGLTFYASSLNTHYDYLIKNDPLVIFNPLYQITNPNFYTASKSFPNSIPSTTFTHRYTSTSTAELSDESNIPVKINSYTYDGNTYEWITKSTQTTNTYSSEEYVYSYSYSAREDEVETLGPLGLSLQAINFATIQDTKSGVLKDLGISGIDNIATTQLPITRSITYTYRTYGDTIECRTTSHISIIGFSTFEGAVSYYTETASQTIIRYSESSISYVTNKSFFAPFTGDLPTIYGAKYENQENKVGMGNIYKKYYEGFSSFNENPAVFWAKNRRTYNATNILGNKGIFSSIKLKEEEKMQFPASGIGNTYEETIENPTSTDETLTYTFTLKCNAEIDQYPSFVSFVLPEASSRPSSVTEGTTWVYGNGKNFIYTSFNQTGGTQTFTRYISFTAGNFDLQYLDSYTINTFLTLENATASCVLPTRSIRNILSGTTKNVPDYVSFNSKTMIFLGYGENPPAVEVTNYYSATKITKESNQTESFFTSYDDIISSSSAGWLLKKATTYVPDSNTDYAFPTKFCNSDHLTQISPYSLLNFTNYFGSTYM